MASWVGSAAGTMARVPAMTVFLITPNRSVTAISVSIAVALGHVPVPSGEPGALGVDRELDPRPLHELADVGVASHRAAEVRRQGAVHALAHGRHPEDAHERRDRDAR